MEPTDKDEKEDTHETEVSKEDNEGKQSEEDRRGTSTMEKVEEERKTRKTSKIGKKHSSRKKKTAIRPSEDKETSDVEKEEQPSKPKDRPNNPWARRKAVVRQSRPVSKQNNSENISLKPREKIKTKKAGQTQKSAQLSDSTSEEIDDKPTNDVKQFSFPHYKILSGATVAAVKMRPQKLAITRTIDEYDNSKHWAVGLFQPTKLTLKLRLLRLFLVWLFFRVLNKQTSWLADKLRIGMLDGPPPPPPPRSKDPSERYIKVFHESSPHPIHVRVRRPPS